MIKKLKRQLCRIFAVSSSAILIAITSMAFLQVLGRYVFKHTFFWVEEISVMGVAWMAAIGVPWMWLERGHIAVDALDSLLSDRARAVLDVVIHIAAAAVGIILLYSGLKAIRLNSGFVLSVLKFDESVRYYYIPFMGVMLTVSSAINLILRGGKGGD